MQNAWGDPSGQNATVRRTSRRRWASWVVVLSLVVSVTAAGWAIGRLRSANPSVRGVVPAEFEYHEGLVLAMPADVWDSELRILAEIAVQAHDQVRVFVLSPDTKGRERILTHLDQRQIPRTAITFLDTPLDSPWIRDFGPLNIKTFQGGQELVSLDYLGGWEEEQGRYRDARAGFLIGNTLGYPLTHVPLYLDGGNLLSNGAGLCLVTRSVLDENAEQYGYSERKVTATLRKQLGARDIFYLDCLDGEPNQHIDMFAAFTAADVVLVGQCDPREDPANAVLLDRAAARLQGHPTPFGPLRVVRIPMPPRDGNQAVTSYTNLVFLNQRVLVPIYPSLNDPRQEEAFQVLRSVLPRHELVPVDAEALMKKGGALHCVTLNLYRLPQRAGDEDEAVIPGRDQSPPGETAGG